MAYTNDVSRKSIEQAFNKPPIIIGGCGRSGTTLLLSILSSHPNIFGIFHETRALCPTAYTEKFNIYAPFRYDQLQKYLVQHDLAGAHGRWCEKTPKNVLFFGRILEEFGGDVRLIHIVRDGRDVVTSIHPKNPHEFWVSPERWVEDVRAGLRYVDHPQLLTVKYEDLILNFRATMKRVLRFLEEDPCRKFLENYKQEGEALPNEATVLYRHSIGRWKRPEFLPRILRLQGASGAAHLLQLLDYLEPEEAGKQTARPHERECRNIWP